ncbi:MAG: carboxypeptidase-like regulatory domain-containing protein [Acidobacteriota bacterium]|nr:carboxypeptidase-like regulatory domain-containing protein [Acidobacteriota bacterium]
MLKRFAIILLVTAFATAAFGQKKSKEPQQKAVSGIVTDASGAPVPGAVVQLKNTRTLQVRSFIAKDTGQYFFQGLTTEVDYELKAESNGKSSAAKILSSFDSHTEARVDLQLK